MMSKKHLNGECDEKQMEDNEEKRGHHHGHYRKHSGKQGNQGVTKNNKKYLLVLFPNARHPGNGFINFLPNLYFEYAVLELKNMY